MFSNAGADAMLMARSRYEFTGLLEGAREMVRLFDVALDGDYTINITNGVAHDVHVGKSAVVHRIGCTPDMLPQPSPLDLIKGGNFEQFAASGPSLLLSDKHNGPWNLQYGGKAADPSNPGRLIHTTEPLTDDRARVTADTATAHGGRHSAKILVPTGVPVHFPVPVSRPFPSWNRPY
jgi:hypothetical protein